MGRSAMQLDLFSPPNPVIADGPAMLPAERRRLRRRASETAYGYYRPPGSGPAGERCGTCAAAEQLQSGGKRFWKCRKAEYRWSRRVRTDIRLKSPACSGWEARE